MKNMNDELLKALADKSSVIEDLSYYEDSLDDEQLEVLNRFKELTPLEKDLIYLRSTKTLREIGELYGVTSSNISILLKGIYAKLRS